MSQEKEILELKRCLKDKDKRLTKLENRWDFIKHVCLFICYLFIIPSSYFILFHAWVYIGFGGKIGLIDFLFNPNITYKPEYYTLDMQSGFVLFFIMIILLFVLTISWIIWFIKDEV